MNTASLDKIIRQIMRKKNTPGLAVSEVQNGKLIYAKGFRSRDLKQHLPMTSDILVGIGSITKSFTAFAILKLEELGRLSLEDSVATHLNVVVSLPRETVGLITERLCRNIVSGSY